MFHVIGKFVSIWVKNIMNNDSFLSLQLVRSRTNSVRKWVVTRNYENNIIDIDNFFSNNDPTF